MLDLNSLKVDAMGEFRRHTSCEKCGSSDAFADYGPDDGGHCFSCGYTVPSKDLLKGKAPMEEQEKKSKPIITAEQNNQIKRDTTSDSSGYRGIRDDISKFFGVRYQVSETDGSVVKTFYPITKNGELSGYKVRRHPKEFSEHYGTTGKDCELFGQFRSKTLTNTVLIVGGEHDMLAAYQMLSDNQRDKRYDNVAVVSPTIGESGAYKQIQAQYAFFSQFKKCIVATDSDEAGREAAEKIAKVLPRGKVYIMNMRRKDPNAYIWDNTTGKPVKAEQEFINDFWAAKPYTPAGVYASTELYQAALDRMDLKMISLPPFMKKASEMLGNGFVKNEIALILAKTSIGKTTLMSAFTQHLALNEQEEVVGVLSLEADKGKFSQNMLSYYLQTPLHRMSKEARKEFLTRPDIAEKVKKLYVKPDGTPTLYVCDDRGASWEQVKEKLLEMIISMGVTVLIVDPYSDLLSGMSVSEQEEVATWFKKVMKEYGITPIIVSHVRKSAGGPATALTEDDAQGSSFLVKASGQTLALERDKQAEDPMERNRTKITILKNRDFSETGPAGSMYYDIATSNLYDYDDWIAEHQ
jgi:KaiC/GvpD/RAD55 family RecA-like ATPase